MNIKAMHYHFKSKLNKIDSQKYQNFLIPEIDIILNEAQMLFIKLIAEPRLNNSPLGFERTQRTIDDIRTVVVRDNCSNITNDIITLPTNYLFYVAGKVKMSKSPCADRYGKLLIQQSEDDFETSPFYTSSFEWKEVNGVFYDGGIKTFTDGTFTNKEACITYIRKPAFIHNAEDYNSGTYTNLNGDILTHKQDCELPEHTHDEIVDLAVYMATERIEPSIQGKAAKLKINSVV